MGSTEEQIAIGLAELRKAVGTLESTVMAMEKRLHLVYTVVVLVIGVVGGPNALQAVMGQ